jgi:hypothetical protein
MDDITAVTDEVRGMVERDWPHPIWRRATNEHHRMMSSAETGTHALPSQMGPRPLVSEGKFVRAGAT